MNNKNAEGYFDPTAYEALVNVTREEKKKNYKPLVYVASPYSGDPERNSAKAEGYCRFAVSKGCIPIAPHLHYPRFLDDNDHNERELGLYAALVLLAKCDAVWVFGGTITEGMSREIAKAEKRGIPIHYFNYKMEEVRS